MSLCLGNFWSPLKRMSINSIMPGELILQELIPYVIPHFLFLTIQFSLVKSNSQNSSSFAYKASADLI